MKRARRRFGQHFLHDPAIVGRLVAAIAPSRRDRIVEIGPGRGALTWALLDAVNRLEAIEIDRDLAAELGADPRGSQRLRIHVEDALDVDFGSLRGGGSKLRVVGNLPYNISTPLLFHLIEHRSSIADMHFMLQKEVVDRIVARPGTKTYGRLTVMLAAFAGAERLFDVGPGAFVPRPKVHSAVIRLRPLPEAPSEVQGTLPPRDAVAFRRIVAAAFAQRRKTLRNSLRELLGADDIIACGLDPQARPETLTAGQFDTLSRIFAQRPGSPGAPAMKSAAAR